MYSRLLTRATSVSISKVLRLMDLDQLMIYEKEGQMLINYLGRSSLTATLSEVENYGERSAHLVIQVGDLSLADLTDLLNLNTSYGFLYQTLFFSEVRIEVFASEGNDLENLLITGNAIDHNAWNFMGVQFEVNSPLRKVELAVQVAHQLGTFNKKYHVIVTTDLLLQRGDEGLEEQAIQVEIGIPVGYSGVWSLRMLPPGVRVSLKALKQLFIGSADEAYQDIDQKEKEKESYATFILEYFNIEFTPSLSPSECKFHYLDFSVRSEGAWGILDDRVAIRDLGFNMELSNKTSLTYVGRIKGTIEIGPLEASADIQLPLDEVTLSATTLKNESERSPVLADFDEILGDGNLTDHLPEDWPEEGIHIDLIELKVVWRWKESTLDEFKLRVKVQSSAGWTLWKKNNPGDADHLVLKDFSLDLYLKRNTSQKWISSGSISGMALIEGVEVSAQLKKSTQHNWQVYLMDPVHFNRALEGVRSLTTIDLRSDDNGVLPGSVEGVPSEEEAGQLEYRTTVLSAFRIHFSTQPFFNVDYISIHLDTRGKTDIVPRQVQLLDASFILQVIDPMGDFELEAAQLAGHLEIGKHQVWLSSKKNGTNSHWTFSGKSQPGDDISISELFKVSLQAIGVDHIDEDQLPKVTIKDLELTYVPDFRHLKFAGKSHLEITEKLEADFAVDLDYAGRDEQEGHLLFSGAGRIRTGGVIFDVAADYTTEKDRDTGKVRGWSFKADMRGTVSLTDLLNDALSLSGIHLPEAMPIDVSVSDVHFESIPSKKYYLLRGAAHLDTLNLSKDKGWQLSLDAILEVTRPEVTQSAPAQGLQYVVDAHAELDLIKNHDTGEKITLEMAAQTMADTEGWFLSGKMAENDSISLDQLVADLQEKLGIDASVPALLKDVEVNGLSATLNTATKDFAFSLDMDFRMMSQSVDLHADLNITHDQEGVPSKHFAGSMNLGSGEDLRVFDLKFDENEGRSWMLGSYVNKKGEIVSLRQLIGTLMGTEVSIPDFWSVTLQDALVTYSGTDQKVLFITHLGNGIDLSNLPLVGRLFQGDQELTLNYQIAAASASFDQSDWQYVNPLLPKDIKPFESSTTIGKGLEITATLNVSGAVKQLELPIATEESAEPGTGGQDTISTTSPVRFEKTQTTDTSVRWFKIQKNIGPVHIDRIGIKYDSEAEEPELKFVLDASLNARGLTIELEGLSVSSPLTRLDPSFNLDGLAIDYKNKLIEIGAALLRDTIEDQVTGLVYDEYNGAAILRFKTLSIGAIGSYAYVDGHPSLFIYAALNMPLGGPAFFFVTGLSAGFGYNRKLIVPSVDKVLEFPLVAQAMGGKSLPEGAGKETLMEELDKIREYIPPSPGNVFLAAGLNFTTFKLIDSTVLLTAAFGEHTELNLLGVSTLSVPPNLGTGIKPLALVQMAIRGAFIPDEGFVGLSGQLTSNSYLFSENCHLTGGFAFHTWFSGEHVGDFVMTVGGYHPHFNVPVHYPTVPRVGIHWNLDERTQIKGEAYFALCAHAIMAGGKLEVNFEEGGLHAYLKAGANFLMSWEPFHYEAKMYTHVGGSYTYHFWGTHHISVDLGTEVELWGPEFGGKASLDLWITTIDIAFGNKKPAKPQALPNWQAFEDKFLPAQNHCQLMPLDGMVAEAAMDDSDALSTPSLGVFNAKHIGIGLETVVPSKLVNLKIAEGGQMPLSGSWNDQIGLSPMDVSRENFNCTLEIEIKHDGQHETGKFQFIPRTKSVPAALWSGNLTPQLNEESFVQEALMGLEIRLEKGTEEKKGTLINTSEASQATVKAIQWSSTDASDQLLSVRNDELQQLTVNDLTNHLDAVHDLAAAFGMGTKVDLSPDLMENWDLMANENNK